MMSQIIAPSHSYKNSQIDYQTGKDCFGIPFGIFSANFFLANETRCIDSGHDSERPKCNFFNHNEYSAWKISKGFSTAFPRLLLFFQSPEIYLFVCLGNLAVQPNYENLAVQPNSEGPGRANSPTNKKIFLSSIKYDLLNKHAKRSDQFIWAETKILYDLVYSTLQLQISYCSFGANS